MATTPINHFNDGWEAGVAAAIKLLRGTAFAYRQMADRVPLPARNHFSFTAAHLQRTDFLGKAELLEGQVKHLEAL